MSVSVGITSRYDPWPNGKPVKSEQLDDGRWRHVLENGRVFVVAAEPNYRLDYLSTFVGAAEGETYAINIALAGLSAVDGFFEVWNYDINESRSYAFRKTVRLTHLVTGDEYSSEEIETALRERAQPQAADQAEDEEPKYDDEGEWP